MPSPFPGMDPYLEGSDWRSAHTQLSVEIARYLVPKVAPKYFVRTEKNHIPAASEFGADLSLNRRSPDVSILQSVDQPLKFTGSVATLEAPLHMDVAIPEEDIQIVVEIYDVIQRSLVTAIEVLSFTNKNKNSRVEYLAQRRKYLCSPVHLLEIDFLRSGERPPMVKPLPQTDYFVILSRADQRPHAEVWPISIRSPLPVVPVPLLQPDADVPLDLQKALSDMYDSFRYDLDLDYSKAPEIPLKTQDAAWAAQLIASTKLTDPKNGK